MSLNALDATKKYTFGNIINTIKQDKMNVLSLFDGMSCGKQALERAGIQVDNYFASEINKYAIQVTMASYPDTIQLGSVVDIDTPKLPKIDLLIGGSPCQSFSFAGKRKGMSTKDNIEILTLDHYLNLKAEGYEFEGQSYLFWEYIRIMNEVKPTYFFLENVMMGEKWERVISKTLGVNPVEINSALVSAQNRRRLYWTNIGMQPAGLFGDFVSIIKMPKDKKLFLKDILQDNPNAKYFLSDKMTKNMSIYGNENDSILGHSGSGGQKGLIFNTNARVGSLCATDYKQPKQIIVAMRGRQNEDGKYEQELEPREDGKTNTLTSVYKDNLVQEEVISGTLRTHNDGKGSRSIKNNKGAAIPARAREDGSGQNVVSIGNRIRRLTPLECERLQTVPDNYTASVSDTQRYKMLGNGWTVDVISHIFKYLNDVK